MARKNKAEIKPRYDYMFDAYVCTSQLAYNEYKNALIEYLNSTWICDDGSLGAINMDYLNNEVNEKRKAFEKAIQRMNAFKTLYGDEIEECKQEV